MTHQTATDRTRLHRLPNRGDYDSATIHAVLDEAYVCHVGMVIDGQPLVIPTAHWRVGDRLYFHGAAKGRMMRHLAAGAEICVSVSLLDGLVLARSAFHHSMNFRSVMLFGRTEAVTDRAELDAVLDALVEKMQPGRSRQVRPASEQELAATSVVALPIAEASAKVRHGPPADAAKDMDIPVWAGVIPLTLTAGEPQPDKV